MGSSILRELKVSPLVCIGFMVTPKKYLLYY